MISIRQREQKANEMYEWYVRWFVESMGDEETATGVLNEVGNKNFGRKFIGTYAQDTFPYHKLQPGQCGISNTDKCGSSGEHWVAVARGLKQKNHLYMYDSFGRPNVLDTLPQQTLSYKLIDTELDSEQREDEDNCGQRCLAWIAVFTKLGENYAVLI